MQNVIFCFIFSKKYFRKQVGTTENSSVLQYNKNKLITPVPWGQDHFGGFSIAANNGVERTAVVLLYSTRSSSSNRTIGFIHPHTFFQVFLYHYYRFLFVWRVVRRTFFPLRMMVFFYLVTTGWIFYISLLCENSINQSIKPPGCPPTSYM